MPLILIHSSLLIYKTNYLSIIVASSYIYLCLSLILYIFIINVTCRSARTPLVLHLRPLPPFLPSRPILPLALPNPPIRSDLIHAKTTAPPWPGNLIISVTAPPSINLETINNRSIHPRITFLIGIIG